MHLSESNLLTLFKTLSMDPVPKLKIFDTTDDVEMDSSPSKPNLENKSLIPLIPLVLEMELLAELETILGLLVAVGVPKAELKY